MVRATEHCRNRSALKTAAFLLLATAIACITVLALSGCSKSKGTSNGSQGSAETSATGSHMAGPPIEVHIDQAVVAKTPTRWNLKTPESAVSSYLRWVAYAYRIGQSAVATPTMTAAEELQMDSYCQYNLEKGRLLDETLDSIQIGKPSKAATYTIVPATESWTYSYRSVKEGNPVIEGPYTAKYSTKYHVVKNAKGEWLVDSVKAQALGAVK